LTCSSGARARPGYCLKLLPGRLSGQATPQRPVIGALNLIVFLWWIGIAMEVSLSLLLPQATISWMRTSVFYVGIFLMLLGIALRWYSAAVLGKYFTFDVAIHG